MDSIILKVKPDELKLKSQDISQAIRNIEFQFIKMGELVNGTKKYWEGDAEDKHIESYRKMKQNIDTILGRLKEHPVELEKMAGVYDKTEKVVEQIGAALPTELFD